MKNASSFLRHSSASGYHGRGDGTGARNAGFTVQRGENGHPAAPGAGTENAKLVTGYKPERPPRPAMVDDTARVWLVEREFTDKGLVTLVYATPDGERTLVEQRAANQLEDVTAARDVDVDRLDSSADAADRDRYADEADRMADRHDPDEII